jgi:hypothetical protein
VTAPHLVVNEMASTSETRKPPLSAILFDLRSVIGLLFVVYGLVLTLRGLIENNEEALAKAGGIALNLWTGLAMLAVGIIFYAWAFVKPPMPPEPHVLEEGGPLHMGHDWAETHHDEMERRHHGHGHERGHGH